MGDPTVLMTAALQDPPEGDPDRTDAAETRAVIDPVRAQSRALFVSALHLSDRVLDGM